MAWSPRVPPDVTVKDCSELWLAAAGPGLKPRTPAGYRQIPDHHILPVFEAVEVRELHQRMIADLLAGKLGRFTPGSVRLVYATIRPA